MASKKSSVESLDKPFGWVAVIASEWNREITEGLLKGVEKELKKNPAVHWKVFWVPGAFEIPLMVQRVARMSYTPEIEILDGQKDKPFFDAVITLGCVIKGKTYHFELVSNQCARGCMEVMLRENIPVVFEVLACYSMRDAKKRSSGKTNAGTLAAQAALQLLQKLHIQ